MGELVVFANKTEPYLEELKATLKKVEPDIVVVVGKKNGVLHFWAKGQPDRHEVAGLLLDAANTYLHVESDAPKYGGTD